MFFIIDYPTEFSFQIALGIIIVFTIFTIISITILFRDLDFTTVKMLFCIFNLILVLPAIFSLVVLFSYGKDILNVDDLSLYKDQFVLIDENLDIKYSIISKESKYYKYEALLYNMQKEDESSNIKEFLSLCLNENLEINCAVKYNSKVYIFNDDYYFNKIFNTENSTVLIDDERFSRENLKDIKEFKYIGSNQEKSLDNELGFFIKKMADSHINYHEVKHLEDNEVNIIVQEKFPLTIDKYKKLLEAFNEFEKENDSYKVNIVFDNHKISYDKLIKEIKKEQ